MARIRTYKDTHDVRILDPIESQASANTNWVEVFANAERAVFKLHYGAVGTDLNMKLTQAQDAASAGAKDITGAVITEIASGAAAAGGVVSIEIGPGALDEVNGFRFVRAEVVADGTCVWGVELELIDLRYQPPAYDATYKQRIAVLT